MRIILITISLMALSSQLSAECRRFANVESEADKVPGFDGRGSFGPLHDTLTLDCLTLVTIYEKDGRPIAAVSDENGKIYFIKAGDYMGENTGIIKEIKDGKIIINQTVYVNGSWESRYVTFK